MIQTRDRAQLLQELLVAEVLARRGEGPLARKRWVPVPRRHERPGVRSVVATTTNTATEPADG